MTDEKKTDKARKQLLKKLERESDLVTIRMLRLGLERDTAKQAYQQAERLFAEAQREFAVARIKLLQEKVLE